MKYEAIPVLSKDEIESAIARDGSSTLKRGEVDFQ
jgi:hypothetical protein